MMELLSEDELSQILPPSFPAASIEVSSSIPPVPDEDAGAECTFCGWCPNPDHCVWSVECPLCGAAPRDHCTNPSNRRTEGLHEERWQLTRDLHGVYYVRAN